MSDFTFIMYLVSFFIGMLVGGFYAAWFNKSLKKNGYLKYELTDKFFKEIKDE